jgi:hypothetical protein
MAHSARHRLIPDKVHYIIDSYTSVIAALSGHHASTYMLLAKESKVKVDLNHGVGFVIKALWSLERSVAFHSASRTAGFHASPCDHDLCLFVCLFQHYKWVSKSSTLR